MNVLLSALLAAMIALLVIASLQTARSRGPFFFLHSKERLGTLVEARTEAHMYSYVQLLTDDAEPLIHDDGPKGAHFVTVRAKLTSFTPKETFYLCSDGYWRSCGCYPETLTCLYESRRVAAQMLAESTNSSRLNRAPCHLRLVAEDGILLGAE